MNLNDAIKNNRVALPIAILLAGIIVAVIMIKSRPAVKTRPPMIEPPAVVVVEAEAAPVTMRVKATGVVGHGVETMLNAEVAGVVTSISSSFDAGAPFDQGDVLYTIDPADYRARLAEAEARLEQAKIKLSREEAEAAVATSELKSMKVKNPSPLATRELMVNEARAALNAAKEGVAQARRNLEKTECKAPFAGRVRARHIGVGQFVGMGQKVAEIYNVDYAEVRLPIPDGDLLFLDLPLGFSNGGESGPTGPAVTLSTTFAGQTVSWRGVIVRVEGELDAKSRMATLVARIDDPYNLTKSEKAPATPLMKGMFVEALIEGKSYDQVVTLPRSALRSGGKVYVATGDGKLTMAQVVLLRAEEQQVYIKKGVKPGQKIIVTSLSAPVEGMAVRIAGGGE